MKNINSILLLSLALFLNYAIKADVWQDVIEGLTSITKKTDPTHKKTEQKSQIPLETDQEHAQKLAHKTSLKAVEAGNLSISAIKNATLHLNNMQQITRVVEYLNNVISKRGNSLEQVEKAKKLLHEILSEARQLESKSHEASKQIEKTLRATTKLAERLKNTQGALPSTISKIWDSIKNTSTQNLPT